MDKVLTYEIVFLQEFSYGFFFGKSEKNQTFFHSESVDWSTIFLWGMNDRKTIVTVATTIIFYDQCNFFSNTSHLFSVFVINLIKQQISKNSILTSTKHAIFPFDFCEEKKWKKNQTDGKQKSENHPGISLANETYFWTIVFNERKTKG